MNDSFRVPGDRMPSGRPADGGPVIHLVPNGGRLANQMIQYMVALKLASLVPGSRIANLDLPAWGIHLPPIEADGATVSLHTMHHLDIAGLARRMNAGEIRRLNYKGYGQRMENLLGREHYRATFKAPRHQGIGYGAEHVVCHVRAGDILLARHAYYVLTPVEFYQEVVGQTGLQPVFMGETGPSLYMRRLREAFPQATILRTSEPIRDFEIIRQSQNIVVGCSTFSWLAAWLSDAKRIILPVNGMLNPLQDERVDLLPFDDPRYRFYLFPINNAVPDWVHPAHHRALAGLWRDVTHEDLRRLLAGVGLHSRAQETSSSSWASPS